MSFFRICRQIVDSHSPVDKANRTLALIISSLKVWGTIGCPTFCPDGKRAAVLASTSCHPELLSELIAPFPVFGVLFESNLFGPMCDGFIVVLKPDYGQEWGLIFGNSKNIFQCKLNMSELRDDGNFATAKWNEQEINRTGSGLDFGCSKSTHVGKQHQSLHGYNEYRFTGSVSLDVRRQVREYAVTGKGALHTQMLVRGHWKMQPHGVGRTERKPTHILPYWRGPLDAPVALRCPK